MEILSVWNQRMNLSGFDLEHPSAEAVDRLIVEPLLVAFHLGRGIDSLLDIGSGGGSPAIPMALVLAPDRTVLIEAKSRKCTFLREAVAAVNLPNVEVFSRRIEDYEKGQHETFSLISFRAIKLEGGQLDRLSSFLSPNGKICWFRAEGPIEVSLPESLTVVHRLRLGRLGSEAVFLARSTWNKAADLDIPH
jgi:16S rRNA (guanine527-N7)-methyltransferase